MYLLACGHLSPQITNPQSVTIAEGQQKSNKLFKSVYLRICDLWKLLADRPNTVLNGTKA
jgi:hypothetical protein